MIDVKVKRVPGADKAIYELMGTGQSGTSLLENLLLYYAQTKSNAPATVSILYPLAPAQAGQSGPPAGLQSASETDVTLFIAQSNLSTVSHPPTLLQGNQAVTVNPGGLLGQTALDFLKLLWECSITGTGGFYLYYSVTPDNTTLPDYLFNENPVATITLLTPLNLPEGLPGFVNAVTISETIDTSNEILFAQAADNSIEEKICIVPPGSTGFYLNRQNPNTAAADPNQTQLLELYNLLEYGISEQGIFNASNPAIPAGPSEPMDQGLLNDIDRDFAPPQVTTGPWKYEGIFPVYPFVKELVNDIPPIDPGLPAPADNPYRAIFGATMQQVTLSFGWNDIFGNTLATDSSLAGTSPAAPGSWPTLSIKLGYTDELIALSQWRNVLPGYVVFLEDELPTTGNNIHFSCKQIHGCRRPRSKKKERPGRPGSLCLDLLPAGTGRRHNKHELLDGRSR